MRNISMTKIAFSAFLFVLLAANLNAVSSAAGATANFDNLMLDPNSHWSGPDPNGTQEDDPQGGSRIVGSFTSGGAQFVNWYNTTYESWSGFAYSNTTDTITPGYANQYSAITGRGHDSVTGPSDNYGVAYGNFDQ